MSMFLITATFQKARSKKHPERPGKIYLTVRERLDGSKLMAGRDINTNISAPDISSVGRYHEELVPFLYIGYCVIDHLRNSGKVFGIDDVAKGIRDIIKNGRTQDFRIENDFIWNTEVAGLKKEFRKFFRMSSSSKDSVSENSDKSLLWYLGFLAEKMLEEGRECSSSSYGSAHNSMRRFLGGRFVALSMIDRAFVEDYAQWLVSDGLSASTQSFYLRTLRMALNHAAARGLVSLEKDTFIGLNTKVTFTKIRNQSPDRQTMLKLVAVDLSADYGQDLARDLFMFGFYCHGMELTDIINLTYANIQDGCLSYRKRGRGRLKSIRLDNKAASIISKYRDVTRGYIFPVKASDEHRLEKSLKNKINSWLCEVGRKIGFDSLSFNMNISAWENFISQVSATDSLGLTS